MSELVLQFLNTPRREPEKLSLRERQIAFKEIYTSFDAEQIRAQDSRCLSCGVPYCSWKCPLHNDIPAWLALAAEGRLFEAAERCHETNSLPEICGRVCPQDRLCEGACTLNERFGAVTIGASEKWIVDTAFAQGWRPDLSAVVKSGKSVAVIGAGPAGLSCADVLARAGVDVTVFDRHEEIGGLLMFGIPAFKLEKRVIKQRRAIFENMGIRFQLNCEIGRDLLVEQLLAQFDAIFLGTGAETPVSANIPGLENPGVYNAIDYLAGSIRQQQDLPMRGEGYIDLRGQRVVVLGGGDTAMDCVRTALRQGAASVNCVYRRREQDMPGSKKEVQHAKEEGAHFIFEQQAIAISAAVDGVKRVRLQKTGSADNTEILADAVIIAYGFRPQIPAWLQAFNVQADAQGKLLVGVAGVRAQQTHHARIFAGGDNVLGADLVVTAVAQGRQAAKDIIAQLI